MVIALPAEGFNSLEANGENLSKVCRKMWSDEDFCINPISDDDFGATYAESLRCMDSKKLLEIVEEIIEERDA